MWKKGLWVIQDLAGMVVVVTMAVLWLLGDDKGRVNDGGLSGKGGSVRQGCGRGKGQKRSKEKRKE